MPVCVARIRLAPLRKQERALSFHLHPPCAGTEPGLDNIAYLAASLLEALPGLPQNLVPMNKRKAIISGRRSSKRAHPQFEIRNPFIAILRSSAWILLLPLLASLRGVPLFEHAQTGAV